MRPNSQRRTRLAAKAAAVLIVAGAGLAVPSLASAATAAPASASASHSALLSTHSTARGAAVQSPAKKHPSRLSVHARPAIALAGSPVILAATVRSSGPTPTGAVVFSAGRTTLCYARLFHGSGACVTRFRSAGIFLVRGFYSGDRKHAPAFGAVLVTALRAATRTSVSVSTTTPYPGEPVTLSATVSSRSPLFPTGRVTFADASGPLCSGRLSGGTAQCTYTWSAAGGPFTVTGFYGGDAAHRGSAGSSSAITVTKLATTTEITSISPDRVPAGTSATVTVTVTNDTTGAPAPTGTVVVEPTNAALDGIAGYSCTVTLTSASDGTGTCDVTPPTGTYGFIYYDATYSGDTTNAGSTYTGGYMVVVPDITTTAVSFSTATGTVGTPVTVTATVTNQAGDNISPTAGGTGTVTFSIGSTPIAGCTDVALTYSTTTGNTATCSYTPTATGSVTVTAAYSGDEANLDSSGSGVFVVS